MPFERRLADRYGGLTGAQRRAADYVRVNPVDLATRPLRTVSRESGVSPAAFTRMARALDYSGLEELREELRAKIGQRVNDFASRAGQLQEAHRKREDGFFGRHLAACQANLASFADDIDHAALDKAVDRVAGSRRVVLMGSLGSTAVVEYLSYMAHFCFDNWTMAGRMGASVGGELTGLGPSDALIVVTKPPFSERSVRMAEMAHAQGVFVLLVTDSYECPALKHASARFIIPTDSPHFYSSYVTTLFFVETLIGLLVARAGDEARTRIAEVEGANRALAEVRDRQT